MIVFLLIAIVLALLCFRQVPGRIQSRWRRSAPPYFYTLRETQIVIESWRRHYNTIRPHASIGYKPPAPEVFMPAFAAWPAALRFHSFWFTP